MSTPKPIVVAYPTIKDGLVLRWYRTEKDATEGDEFMSVSRNGASIYCAAAEVPPEAAADAVRAATLFELGRDEEVHQLATHRPVRFMGREIEAIPGRDLLDAPAVAYDPEDKNSPKDGGR